MTIETLAGTDLGTHTTSYDDRDAILYALAVGARAEELSLVYEKRLRVLPTFALPLGLWAVEAAGALGVYDPTTSLHVAQTLDLHRPLPPRAQVDMAATITNVWDRGNAAVVDICTVSDYFDATYAIYLKGLGGFGGLAPPRDVTEGGGSDPHHTTVPTRRDQAVLYRLTGDRHPVHVDPEVAQQGGFDRPILHGLCTLGIAVLESSRLLDRDPTTVQQLRARFAAPVAPGDVLDIETVATTSDAAVFTAGIDGNAVLKGGHVRWSSDRG